MLALAIGSQEFIKKLVCVVILFIFFQNQAQISFFFYFIVISECRRFEFCPSLEQSHLTQQVYRIKFLSISKGYRSYVGGSFRFDKKLALQNIVLAMTIPD